MTDTITTDSGRVLKLVEAYGLLVGKKARPNHPEDWERVWVLVEVEG